MQMSRFRRRLGGEPPNRGGFWSLVEQRPASCGQGRRAPAQGSGASEASLQLAWSLHPGWLRLISRPWRL